MKRIIPLFLILAVMTILMVSILPVQAAEDPAACPFTDVKESASYYRAVMWAMENAITSGTSDTTFSPAKTCTRAQVVTFLWRFEGCPAPEATDHSFTDLQEGASYYDAVLWAVENGITSGTTDTTFSPAKSCTRGQIMTFLWRAAGEPQPESREHTFSDLKEGASYYDAVLWAVECGITKGTSDTTFSPSKVCTRAQAVTFLYREYLRQIGHIHDYCCGEADVKPTCTAQGYTKYFCECGEYSRGNLVPALGHSYKNTTTAPTCTAKGYTRHVCTRCKAEYVDAYVNPLGHDFKTGEAQNHTANICTRCGYTTFPTHKPGWSYECGYWYYYDSNGKPFTGRHTISGVEMIFDSNGIWKGAEGGTLKQLVNAQPLNPQPTGIPALDKKVQSIFSKIFKSGYTTYDKLKAIYAYEAMNFDYPTGGGFPVIDSSEIWEFTGGKVFAKYSEAVYCYEAYWMMVDQVGVCDDYAAAFMVMTRALGLEGFVVSGTISGKGHAWNNLRVCGQLFAFDAQVEAKYTSGSNVKYTYFGLRDSQMTKYSYYDRERDLAIPTGFAEAEPISLRLTLKDKNGTTTETYNFDINKARTSMGEKIITDFLWVNGDVEYKVEVLSGPKNLMFWASNMESRVSAPVGSVFRGVLKESPTYQYIDLSDFDSYRKFDFRIS